MAFSCLFSKSKTTLGNELAPIVVKHKGDKTLHHPSTFPVELGPLKYQNICGDGKHGNVDLAIQASESFKDRPLFVNFVEWPGCSGSKDGGRIFAEEEITRAINEDELFTAVAFNTWDRYKQEYSLAFSRWGGKKAGSDWGHLEIYNPRTGELLASTGLIYNYQYKAKVMQAMRQSLEKMNLKVPSYLQ